MMQLMHILCKSSSISDKHLPSTITQGLTLSPEPYLGDSLMHLTCAQVIIYGQSAV